MLPGALSPGSTFEASHIRSGGVCMDTPVVKPALLDCGTAAPGSSATQQCQLHAPSDAVVTAAIVQDSARIFRVKQIASYDLVPGVGPHPNTVLDGQAALPVSKGQLVAVDVEA